MMSESIYRAALEAAAKVCDDRALSLAANQQFMASNEAQKCAGVIRALPVSEDVGWQPIETMPKSGEFLLAVWEGDWRKPRQQLRAYHAFGGHDGPSWAMRGHYRTEEGGAYQMAGWMPLPPKGKDD